MTSAFILSSTDDVIGLIYFRCGKLEPELSFIGRSSCTSRGSLTSVGPKTISALSASVTRWHGEQCMMMTFCIFTVQKNVNLDDCVNRQVQRCRIVCMNETVNVRDSNLNRGNFQTCSFIPPQPFHNFVKMRSFVKCLQ